MIKPSTFQLYFRDTETPAFIVKTLTFSGGEVLIQANDDVLKSLVFFTKVNSDPLKLLARIQSSEDLVGLYMVVDILQRYFGNKPIELLLPYIPYARQDRVCNAGEAHSLKVFGRMINSLGFSRVISIDPHSAVSEAVIDNLVTISQKELVSQSLLRIIENENVAFVAPDAGANKKVSEFAKEYSDSFVRCDKLRDLQTGKIIETIVYADTLIGKTCIIVDDICDGGRTFVELAKCLKHKGAGKIILMVSHGIFSNGIQFLYENGIDEIFVTDSFDFTKNDGVNILEVIPLLLSK